MTSRAKNALSGLLGPGKSKRGQAVRFSRSAPPAPGSQALANRCAAVTARAAGAVCSRWRCLRRLSRCTGRPLQGVLGRPRGGQELGLCRCLHHSGRGGRYRFLCARELQVSIADSVHKLLADRIAARGLDEFSG